MQTLQGTETPRPLSKEECTVLLNNVPADMLPYVKKILLFNDLFYNTLMTENVRRAEEIAQLQQAYIRLKKDHDALLDYVRNLSQHTTEHSVTLH